MYKILIVEDDLTIASILKNHLCKWGYEAEIISDFNNVVSSFIEYDPQLVVLDIALPFYNGFHWCTEIRKISKVPIIFASSASDNMNLIMAINMGADDFIAKPFDLNVVVAKVQALIRRTYSFQGQTNILESNGAVLNLGDTTLTYNNKKLELSKNEFKILQILIENKNKTVSRDDIMRHLWNSDSFIDDNTLTVNVTRLRRKLEDIELKDFIKTKKGIGYIIGD
ncbi:response regulator transcription factor [uncultured Clostridium sp.]|uniref:response regulator transcription factor n=1 Tax=uncultured Clostridium sp. TaxID=59620 RepID=UPI0028E30998|nr:response regulator transcription factor [uncultured Clostridium sp.]